MGCINLSIHPLFFAFGFYYALIGKIFIFIIYTLSAVVHELGHSICASNCGYRLNKITLMPFGAVIKCDQTGMRAVDQMKIALAGPLINLAIALFFVATWWIVPEVYAYTDTVVEANLSLAFINMLPVYPLDGGRMLYATLKGKIGSKKAFGVSKFIGVSIAVMLIVAFIYSIFNQINISLLFFSLFVFLGAIGKNNENVYVKAYCTLSRERLRRGLTYKKQAVDKSATIKKMMSMLDDNCVNEIVVFDGDKEIRTLSQAKIVEIIQKGQLNQPIERYI